MGAGWEPFSAEQDERKDGSHQDCKGSSSLLTVRRGLDRQG